jgi:hypothetical protein
VGPHLTSQNVRVDPSTRPDPATSRQPEAIAPHRPGETKRGGIACALSAAVSHRGGLDGAGSSGRCNAVMWGSLVRRAVGVPAIHSSRRRRQARRPGRQRARAAERIRARRGACASTSGWMSRWSRILCRHYVWVGLSTSPWICCAGLLVGGCARLARCRAGAGFWFGATSGRACSRLAGCVVQRVLVGGCGRLAGCRAGVGFSFGATSARACRRRRRCAAQRLLVGEFGRLRGREPWRVPCRPSA